MTLKPRRSASWFSRIAVGVAALACGSLGFLASCGDSGTSTSSTSTGTSMGCVGAGQTAASDAACCSTKRDNGKCCVGLSTDAMAAPGKCMNSQDCCTGGVCDTDTSECCLGGGGTATDAGACCSGTLNGGKCCGVTPGECAAPGCSAAATSCTTTDDCCAGGTCEHGNCCRYGNSPCTNDLQCCSHTCNAMGKCT